MITYISFNTIKAEFEITEDIGMSHAKYDITDLFEHHPAIVDATETRELI